MNAKNVANIVLITITSRLEASKALLYEFPGRKGRKKYVPTYTARAEHLPTGEYFYFSVTRCSSHHVFGERPDCRYGEKGECPPSGEAYYHGVVREDGVVGFRIEFFDEEHAGTRILVAPNGVTRKNIQIHFGAAAAYGCILVAGRRRSYCRNFESPMRSLLAHGDPIHVVVEPR